MLDLRPVVFITLSVISFSHVLYVIKWFVEFCHTIITVL